MLPVQILLNNLLYDFSQSTITTDKVDDEYVERPKRWDIGFIRRFMISLGPVSSLFDFLTFFTMLFGFILPVVPFALLGSDIYSQRCFPDCMVHRIALLTSTGRLCY